MVSDKVRPIALCVFRRNDWLLVYEGYDSTERDYYYRPLGGTIEFGERSAAAVVREIKEELDAVICNVRSLGVLENLFVVDGRPGHENVMLYEADFVDQTIYERSPVWGQEDDGSSIKAYWKLIGDFEEGMGRLVPEGLLEMLTGRDAIKNGGWRT